MASAPDAPFSEVYYKRLRELYGVAGNEYKIVNRGATSPERALFLRRSPSDAADKPNKKIRAKIPTADWKKDVERFPGLAKAVEGLLRDHDVARPWDLRLAELWRVDEAPETVVFGVRMDRGPRVTLLTAVATRHDGVWDLQPLQALYGQETDAETGPDDYVVWDIVDLDGDGDNDVVFVVNAYSNRSFSVYRRGRDGRHTLVHSGGGYSL